jgi:hypothetical protein
MEDLHYTPIVVRDILQKRKEAAGEDGSFVGYDMEDQSCSGRALSLKRNSCSRAADWG